MPRLREDALDWFVRRRNEGFGVEQERAFQSWLQADPRHLDAFAHWQAEWQAFDDIPADVRATLQRSLAYEAAMQAASAAGAPQSAAVTNKDAGQTGAQTTATAEAESRAWRRVLVSAFAVTAVVAITAGAGMMAWNNWQAQPVFAQSFTSPRGGQVEVPLPDGSRLRLDTATRVAVTFYRNRREVALLGGQAVFAVQADGARPFRVRAGPLHVTVVGTRFSVRYTPDVVGGDGVHVAVEEGKVRVERAGMSEDDRPHDIDQPAVFLAPGQQVEADAAGVLSAVAPVPSVGIAPWRENRVNFDDTRLDRVLAELARYRETQLVVRDPAVAALRITGVFDPRDLVTFKRVLPVSLPVQLRDVNGVTEVISAR